MSENKPPYAKDLSRLFLGIGIILLCLILTALLTGCKAKQTREQMARVAEQTETVLAHKQSLDQVLRTLTDFPESEHASRIRAVLTPESQILFDQALSRGRRALDWALEFSRALGESAQTLLSELKALEERLKNAKDEDDVTMQLVTAGLASLFPILAPIFGLAGRALGRREAASHVANSIAVARSRNADFDKYFDSPLGTVMAKELDKNPRIAKIVRRHKKII